MNIKFQHLYDDHNCETCGYSSATGLIVWFDDKEVFRIEPVAHCYDGQSLRNNKGQECSAHEKILELLGYNPEEIFDEN